MFSMKKLLFLSFMILASMIGSYGTALSDLADSMQPGDWAELTTYELSPSRVLHEDFFEVPVGSGTSMLVFADSAEYDPITNQVFYVGTPANPTTPHKFIIYDLDTNLWRSEPEPPGLDGIFGHGYDHNAIDVAGRKFFFRKYFSTEIFEYDIDNGGWNSLPNALDAGNVASAIEYFPERDGLLFYTGGVLQFYDDSTNSWSTVGTYGPDTYHQMMEYNPVYKEVVFGGGNGLTDFYAMNEQGVVRTLASAPITYTSSTSTLTVDHTTGDVLLLKSPNLFYKYDSPTDTWTQLDSSSVPIYPMFQDTIEVQIPTSNVIMFTQYTTSEAKVYLYKYSEGGNLPTTSLSVSPTSIVEGSAIDLTWSSTDADTCSASGAWNGTKTVSGTEQAFPTADSTYTLVCTNTTSGLVSSASNAVVTVTPNSPVLNLSTNSVDFGSVSINSTSTEQIVTLTNIGAQLLTITSATTNLPYVVSSNNCASLTQSSSCQVGITFSPTSSGSQAGSLSITSNDASSPHSVSLSGSGFVQGSIPPGALLHYSFDSATISGNTVSDLSGNGNDGTISGATSVAGQSNEALNFVGSSDHVDMGNFDIGAASGMTISLWMNPSSLSPSDYRLISKATGTQEEDHYFMVSGHGSDDLRFRLKTGGDTETLIATGATVSTGSWTHVVATYDGSDMRIYQDVVEVGSTGKTGTLDSSAAVNAEVGRNPDGYGGFNGAIDEVIIYDRALTAQEILGLFTGTPPGPDTIPPSRFNGGPSGELSSGTTITTIGLQTNEPATCRYDTNPGVPYASMSNSFSSVLTSTHSQIVGGLSDGQLYNYYVKCVDSNNNENTDDLLISFTVASPGSGGGSGTIYYADPNNHTTVIDLLGPGDTMLMLPGFYPNTPNTGMALYNIHGNSSHRITISGSDPNDRPRIQGSSQHNIIRIRDSSHITFKDIEIEGQNLGGDGIKCDSGSAHDITIENVYIHGVGSAQGVVGISTNGCHAWNWIIRNNVIERAGTGAYLGHHAGALTFINATIENNLFIDTLGYNMEIKHQSDRLSDPDMPSGKLTNVVRNNVFIKENNANGGGNARPNLLVGYLPTSGAGINDEYEIYGNFFYQNPVGQPLFQGEGRVNFYNNVLFNSVGDGITIRPHNGQVQDMEFFHNTIVTSARGIRIIGGSGFTQNIRANAIFSDTTAISGGTQVDNLIGDLTLAAQTLNDVVSLPGSGLDLFPQTGMALGATVDLSDVQSLPFANVDFNEDLRTNTYYGAYTGNGVNPGWALNRTRKGNSTGQSPPPDTTPPTLSAGSPSGNLVSGTTSETLQVTTNEAATCRYSTTSGVDYSSMTNTFTTTGSTSHSTLVQPLSDGVTYNYYIRCQDTSSNANTNDYPISFTILNPTSSGPVISNGLPSTPLPSGTTTANLQVTTDVPSTCRYDTSMGVDYNSMTFAFTGTSATVHNSSQPVSDGQNYNFYVRCHDGINSTDTDYPISFSVDSPADTTAPVMSNGLPLGELTSGTTSTTLSLSTDETANCRYSTSAGIAYSTMSNIFDVTDALAHSEALSGLSDGNLYEYYTKCSDTSGNANIADLLINFSVGQVTNTSNGSNDTTAPVILNVVPTGAIELATNPVVVNVTTDEDSFCKMDRDPDTAYADMEYDFEDFGTFHDFNLSSLAQNVEHRYYVKCQDNDNNINSADYTFSFSLGNVNQPPPPPNNDGGGSGGGGGGGGGGSSSSVVDNINNQNVCVPHYIRSEWSACLNGEQQRSVTDQNSCNEDKIEKRVCNIANTEIENKFLNAKVLDLTKDDKKKRTYKTALTASYNELFKTLEKVDDDSFIVVDESTGDEYLGRLVNEEAGEFFYSLDPVEESLIGDLKAEGLVGKSVGERVDGGVENLLKSAWFKTVVGIMALLLTVGIVMWISFYVRRVHALK